MQAPCSGRNTRTGRPTAGTLLHDTSGADLARRVVPWCQPAPSWKKYLDQQAPARHSVFRRQPPAARADHPGTEANT